MTDRTAPQEGPALDPEAYPELRAAPPSAGDARDSYLSLLALALCDLAAASSLSVHRRTGGGTYSREIVAEEVEDRLAGSDWPLHGLTMGGPRRLAALREAVEQVVSAGVEGDVIEAGCWRGGAAMMLRATLDTMPGAEGRTVFAADSFAGHPMPEDLARVDYLAAPLEDVRGSFERFGLAEGVEFAPGFFGESLPGLADRSWALLVLAGGTEESVRISLQWLYPRLAQGGTAIVDGYGASEDVRGAVDAYRAEHGIGEPLTETAGAARWTRTSSATPDLPPQPAAGDEPVISRRSALLPGARIPGVREIELDAEVLALRRRLALARHEIDQLRSGADPASIDRSSLELPAAG